MQTKFHSIDEGVTSTYLCVQQVNILGCFAWLALICETQWDTLHRKCRYCLTLLLDVSGFFFVYLVS